MIRVGAVGATVLLGEVHNHRCTLARATLYSVVQGDFTRGAVARTDVASLGREVLILVAAAVLALDRRVVEDLVALADWATHSPRPVVVGRVAAGRADFETRTGDISIY